MLALFHMGGIHFWNSPIYKFAEFHRHCGIGSMRARGAELAAKICQKSGKGGKDQEKEKKS